MKIMSTTTLVLTSLLICLISSCQAYSNSDDFIACLSDDNRTSISSNIVYTPSNSSYLSILRSSIRNPRFTSSSTPRPLLIVTPVHESQIQGVVHCARQNKLQIRTRSGGHDYEGLSYRSTLLHHAPFIILDMVNLAEIAIDLDHETAWVQTGASIGQLYYAISQASGTLAFPAGGCPTVGLGGYISGGGYGPMLRKFGLAADNVLDARIVNADGTILDRKTMGEDLFWAIRGGGGASFGVITAWKIRLVRVPETVTIFAVSRTLEQNATELAHRWQFIAPNLPKELLIVVIFRKTNGTIQATFTSLFLGGVDRLMPLLGERFPELGVRREDCNEVRWVQSTLMFAGYPIMGPTEVLTRRAALTNWRFKGKSDYVEEAISERGLEGLWGLWGEGVADRAEMVWVPYGGRMSEVEGTALPFPHRKGNLFKILYLANWDEEGETAEERHVGWMRRVYEYMAQFVSKSPRRAYVNYRDLDLGVNSGGDDGSNRTITRYARARVWGFRYFKNNFERLVRVKSKVDPGNFFRNEQSIPPLYRRKN